MTNTRTTIHIVLLLSVMFLLTLVASASEVTGTLSSGINGSSGTASNSQASGTLGSTVNDEATLGGTVTSSNGSSGGGGSSSGGRSNNGGNNSNGSVLGASDTNNLGSPSFPNAGFDPGDGDEEEEGTWITIMAALMSFSLLAFAFGHYSSKQP